MKLDLDIVHRILLDIEGERPQLESAIGKPARLRTRFRVDIAVFCLEALSIAFQ